MRSSRIKGEAAVTIEEADAINKSYPDFYDHLKLLGAQGFSN
jgi:3-phosphoshikimate 1-carboxyvinyltransferase